MHAEGCRLDIRVWNIAMGALITSGGVFLVWARGLVSRV